MRETLPPYEVLDHPPEEALFLYGPPSRLSGHVRFDNRGAETAIVREARLVVEGWEGLALCRLHRARLRPGEARRVPVVFALQSSTLPGSYRGEMEVAGARRPVEIQVTEAPSVVVTPPLLVIEAPPGERVEKEIVVDNQGNVATHIDAVNALPLDDELLSCSVIRRTAAAFSEQPDATVGRLLHDVAEATEAGFRDAGVAGLTCVDGAQVIAPGTARTVRIAVDVPSGLRHGTRYGASMPVGIGSLNLMIVSHHRRTAERAAGTAKKSGSRPATVTREETS